MKKTVLMALFTMVMVGCKEESKKEEIIEAETQKVVGLGCSSDLSEYEAKPNVQEQAKWLRDNGAKVCKKDLYPYILKEHGLKSQEYEDLRIGYGTQEPLKLKWKDIRAKIDGHFYDKYVGFKDEIDGSFSLELIDAYTEKRCCYSIPLFWSIADTLNLGADNTTVFEFIRTKKTESPIVFRVSGTGFEMNYSTKPTKKNNTL
ncbi:MULTISPECIES: hypothetical protein [Flavobacterium]|uniref:Lipoprotein n=1 Tax=Flavobacterium hankyongi TaxID=1176532 RepID=A0ABP8ZTR7_9FLAO|nr:hypothetical protein [Flavobacterium sp. N1846]